MSTAVVSIGETIGWFVCIKIQYLLGFLILKYQQYKYNKVLATCWN